MDNHVHDAFSRNGTVGGVLMVLLFRCNLNNVLATALLAAIGAVVSFTVTALLKLFFKRLNRK